MVVARSSPVPPVRFTIVCTLTASMAFSRSAGGTLGFCARRREMCVWKSITGKRARPMRVSFTCSMLFGSNSASGSGAIWVRVPCWFAGPPGAASTSPLTAEPTSPAPAADNHPRRLHVARCRAGARSSLIGCPRVSLNGQRLLPFFCLFPFPFFSLSFSTRRHGHYRTI